MPPLLARNVALSLVVALLLVLASGVSPAAYSQEGQLQLAAGFSDTWKLGHVCPIRVSLSDELAGTARAIEAKTVDGDGVETTYRQLLGDTFQSVIWLPIQVGRPNSEIRVEVLGPGNNPLAVGEIDLAEATVLDSGKPLLLAIGSALGVSELSRKSADGSSSSFATVVIDDAADLPLSWRDYESCDLIVISCSDVDLLKSLGPKRWTAIETWIRRGGGCLISMEGSTSDDFAGLETLQSMLPGKISAVGRVTNPGPLESRVGSNKDPLGQFGVVIVEPSRGEIELSLSDTLSRSVPWWISYPHGHGTIQFLASDLDSPAFQAWKDRGLFWEMLIDPYFDQATLDGNSTDKQASDSNYLGYSDLVGQLRAMLDVFGSLRVVSFGQVAALLIATLVIVGPLDYFVSVRWLKRPDVSWYFAGATLLAISAGLTVFYTSIRPDSVRVNSAQIVDIDVERGAVSGRLWSHVFTGAARKFNIEAKLRQAEQPIALDWQGLPGGGLGGLNSQLNTDRGMPAYQIEIESDGTSRFKGVGIAAAGTKCVSANWVGSMDLSGAEFSLQELPGVDQLKGSFQNPLETDLKDAVLFYHNWFYRLDSRILPGGVVTISEDTIPKDIARKLNERKTVDDKVTSTKWDPSDRQSIDRLLELMMFHKRATGQNYTSLTHRFQPHIDQSNLLETDRAILVGRVDVPWASIHVEESSTERDNEASELTVQQDMDRIWCRLVIPVEKSSAKQ